MQTDTPSFKDHPAHSKQRVDEVVAWILASQDMVRSGTERLRVAMDLPPFREVDPITLAEAVASVLKSFRIQVPPEMRLALEQTQGAELTFLAPALEAGLPQRTVVIRLSAEARTLLIRGEPPVDGQDGYLSLLFDYEMRPGLRMADGSIDFRDINRFPQARAGQVLAHWYEPTMGMTGTDVHGLPIPGQRGTPYTLKTDEGIEVEEDFDTQIGRHCRIVKASKPGIVQPDFAGGQRDPAHLQRLGIQNQLIVGDVDFSTGNIGNQENEIHCVVDVVVNGDIRGHFSVLVEGQLEVKGAIDGERVVATGSVKASFITSYVQTGGAIETKGAVNAELVADAAVIVTREVANCRIATPNFILRPRGTTKVLCGRVTIAARTVVMDGVAVRNLIEIDLGSDLFSHMDQLTEREDSLAQAEEIALEQIRSRMAVVAEKLRLAQATLEPSDRKDLKRLIDLTAALLNWKLSPEEGYEQLEAWSRSAGANVITLSRHVRQILGLQTENLTLWEERRAIEKERETLAQNLRGLCVRISGTIRASGRIVIRCGEEERIWQTPPQKSDERLQVNLAFVPGRGLVGPESVG